MATVTNGSFVKKRRPWRIALWFLGSLAALLVAAYFVVTSSAFIKGVILPRVSASLHAEVTVTDISVHPFSHILVRGLKVQVKGQEPVITAPEILASYSLWSILAGNLRISEIALVSPTILEVENPDGSSNLDALEQATAKKPGGTQSRPAKSSKPAHIDLGKITVTKAAFWKIKNYAGNRRDVFGITDVNVTLANVKNGGSGTLQFGGYVQAQNNPPAGPAGTLQAAAAGNFSFTLSPDLKPAPVTGSARLDVSRADGAFEDFSRFGAALDCNVTPQEIKQTVLHFQRAGVALGELVVSGPLDMEKMEGRLKMELQGIDRRLLDLAGNASGIDFGTTTITSSSNIELTRSGALISAAGRFDAGNVQLTRAGQTTPTLNLSATYAVTVDSRAETALLQTLDLSGTQNGNPLLGGHLTRPMTVAWGKGGGGAGDSALELTVTGLNLADWRPFLGKTVRAGDLGLSLKLTSQQAGRQLAFNLDSQIQNFSGQIGSQRTAPATVGLRVRGQAADFKQFNLSEYRLGITQQNQSLVTVSGSGTYTTDGSADLQVTLQGSPPMLAPLLPQSGVSFSAGTAELKGRITQKHGMQTVTGRLVLANLTGRAGSSRFRSFDSTMDLDVNQTPKLIQINKINGTLGSGGAAGGEFAVSGQYDIARSSARLSARLTGFNQNGLRPLLEPLLADKKLVSISADGDVTVEYDAEGSSAVKASLTVANLVVSDSLPATPLEAGLQIDTAIKKSVADIRQFQIKLTPTERAKNQVQLQGQMDFSQANTTRGNLKLTADSLDVTRYYDLFAGKSKSSGAPAPAAAPAGNANPEPPAKVLPLNNFTIAANIGRLYLHEIEITGWQTTARINGGDILIKPFQLTLNGAPVNATADLNLGVPGYRYDLALDADRVPVAPVVDTFLPNLKGQMSGNATARAQIRGAGVTGVNLKKNLTGQFAAGVTNLNLAVENIHNPILRNVINVVATIPEILGNPGEGVTSLIGQVVGQGGGLMDVLRKSPIQIINAQCRAGDGRIDLESATAQSTAFKADGRGSIYLAPVLADSPINIPVTIAVSQPIAHQLNLAPGSTTASAGYVSLPQFLTMKGTLGAPKSDVNKLAIGGMTLKSLGGGLLNTTTNAASTVGHLLNNLFNHVK